MTDVDTVVAGTADRAALTRLKLSELQALAADRGIPGAAKLRKGELVDSLSDAPEADTIPAPRSRSRRATASTAEVAALAAEIPATEVPAAEAPATEIPASETPAAATPTTETSTETPAEPSRSPEQIAAELDSLLPDVTSGAEGDENTGRGRNRNRNRGGQGGRPDQGANGKQNGNAPSGNAPTAGGQNAPAGEDGDGRGRGRYRDRKRGRGQGQNDEFEPEISDDDVLIPVAGILDVLDNYAFVRTSGYLPGPNDVYVSLGQVKKYNLRKGDAVVGAIRQPRENEQSRQKYNAIVKIDSINGQGVDEAAERIEFGKLTPIYPKERLRLETTSEKLSTRIIDLIAPIGKGQRGLIVAPPKAGKTIILQAIAKAIAVNNPEVHIMVVGVDERPPEVTHKKRAG